MGFQSRPRAQQTDASSSNSMCDKDSLGHVKGPNRSTKITVNSFMPSFNNRARALCPGRLFILNRKL